MRQLDCQANHWYNYKKEMAISDFLTIERILIYDGNSREEVLGRLIAAAADSAPFLEPRKVQDKVMEREHDISTNVAPGIAIPHAIFEEMPRSIAALALCRKGIEWQHYSSEPVYLVLLLLGSRMTHLAVLSEATRLFQKEEVYRAVLNAGSPGEIYEIVTGSDLTRSPLFTEKRTKLSRLIFQKGRAIADTVGGRLILHTDALTDAAYIIDLVENSDTILVTTDSKRFPERFSARHIIFELPFRGARRSVHVQFSMLFLVSSGLLDTGQIAVNVYGIPESGLLDSIRITHMDEGFDFHAGIGIHHLIGELGRQVLTRVLQLAGEIAREGREGKPVGTLFVVGDHEHVAAYTRQLIINPFNRYDEQHRNIIDPGLEETVKEFAKIDGAFVIREDGVILSCGTYIAGVPKESELQSGLGARHAAALTISTLTSAFAVAISESTRKISVFHGGKKIVEL